MPTEKQGDFIGSKVVTELKLDKPKPEIEKITFTGSCPDCGIPVKGESATRKKGRVKLDNCEECKKRKKATADRHKKAE